MKSYDQTYADWSYLWSAYGPADDMTGGYVDQEDLAAMLKSPTKSTAQKCLARQIDYWFDVGPCDNFNEASDRAVSDERLDEIAERYCVRHRFYGTPS